MHTLNHIFLCMSTFAIPRNHSDMQSCIRTPVASSSIISRIVPIRIQQNKVDNHSAPPRPPRKILELQFRAQNNSDPELLNYQKQTRFFQQFLLRVISIIYHQCGIVLRSWQKTIAGDPDFSALSEMHKKMKRTSIANPQICQSRLGRKNRGFLHVFWVVPGVSFTFCQVLFCTIRSAETGSSVQLYKQCTKNRKIEKSKID